MNAISNHEDGPDGETFDPLIDPVAERIKGYALSEA